MHLVSKRFLADGSNVYESGRGPADTVKTYEPRSYLLTRGLCGVTWDLG